MHLLWKRYSRSGAAPLWFYFAMALGFASLAVWAIVARDWLVLVLAVVMIGVTAGGSRIMRSLRKDGVPSIRDVGTRRQDDE